jgi:high-affinity iron transporter
MGGAALLALVILCFAGLLEGDREDYFQIIMAGFAALFILQTVVWMHKQGRELPREFDRGAERAATSGRWWGLFFLSAIAVMREGSETVIFLYGIIASAGGTDAFYISAVLTGFALAGALYGMLHVGARGFPWTIFFRVTEIFLLALAGSLLMTAFDRAVGLEIVPLLSGPLWDTSWLVDETSALGGLLASMTGYRARPDLTSALVYAFYWLLVGALLRPGRPRLAETMS